MSARALRVGLFGRLGAGNIGNDATMEAMLAYLKAEQPEAELDALCSGPEQVTQRYGLPASQLNWLHTEHRARSRAVHAGLTVLRIAVGAVIDAWRTGAWVRRHDVVIVPGMGVLEANLSQRPWQLPYSMFLMSAFGRLFGTKVAFVSVGATVVRERLTGRLVATAARLAHYRSFRDEYSLEAARRMKAAGPRDRVYPDLVFALPTPPAAKAQDGTVGVGVMAYYGTPADRHRANEVLTAYVATMQGFVRWLIDNGHRVRLLIGDGDDEPVARTILAAVQASWRGPGPCPVGYEPFSSVDELMHQLTTVETVVGTRFHTVLVALKLTRPTLAIGYGRKHDALMTQLGVGDRVVPIGALDLDRLKECFTALEADSDRIGRTLAERHRDIVARLEDQFAELTAVLFTPGKSR